MSHANLNRRAILAGAAAVPALALPPVIASAAEVDPIIELAERCIRAHEVHGAACTAFEPVDQAMIDWRAANPPPKPAAMQAAMTSPKAEYDAAGRVLNRKDVGEYFVAHLDKNFVAEATVLSAAEKRAIDNWRRREQAAELQTGFTRLSAAMDAAGDAAARLVEQLRDAKPRSFAGLAAKARVARLVVDDELNCSIAWDIAEIQESDRA